MFKTHFFGFRKNKKVLWKKSALKMCAKYFPPLLTKVMVNWALSVPLCYRSNDGQNRGKYSAWKVGGLTLKSKLTVYSIKGQIVLKSRFAIALMTPKLYQILFFYYSYMLTNSYQYCLSLLSARNSYLKRPYSTPNIAIVCNSL